MNANVNSQNLNQPLSDSGSREQANVNIAFPSYKYTPITGLALTINDPNLSGLSLV